MSDQTVAEIARRLIRAMQLRAKTRHQDDQKAVLGLQTELAAAINAEITDVEVEARRSLVRAAVEEILFNQER